MLSFLLIVAILNLGLGFALAIWLEEPPTVAPPRPSLAPAESVANVAEVNSSPSVIDTPAPAPEASPTAEPIIEPEPQVDEQPVAQIEPESPLVADETSDAASSPALAEASVAAESSAETSPADDAVSATAEPAATPEPPVLSELPPSVAEPEPPVVQSVVVKTSDQPPLDLPNEWLDILGDVGEVGSFVEASAQVLKLEVGKYRQQLVEVENEIRRAAGAATSEQLVNWAKRLKAINADWLMRQSEVAGMLTQHTNDANEWRDASTKLSELLEQQTSQIETTSTNLAAFEKNSESSGRGPRMLREIARLVDLAHTLRDRMHETLLAIVCHDGRLNQIDRRLHFEAPSIYNRTGIEQVFHEWWRDDPTRTRQLSVVGIDVDRVGNFNERLGTVTGDALMGAVGQLLSSLVRRDRGFDVVARVAGQRFLLFLGDTGPRGATSAAERIRQTVAATSFEYRGQEVPLTVSCGVTEVLPADTTASVFARVGQSIAMAKRSSRNCTILDEGAGPEPVNPPVYEVKARIVRIDEVEAS